MASLKIMTTRLLGAKPFNSSVKWLRCERLTLGALQGQALTMRRCLSSSRPNQGKMAAWQTQKYGGVENLEFTMEKKIPSIFRPDEVLIEVHAASVNPIDTMMIGGYGASTLNPLRRLTKSSEFPLTVGRDFSGIVVGTGKAVPSSKFKPGDEVWGAIGAHSQGTHAEYTVASAFEISKKPVSLSHTEAASIPYVAATTWSAVSTVGWLSPKTARTKRVLILGGSGGVGTFATQLLKAWGSDVTVTCATDAVEQCLGLGADRALDYCTQNVREELLKLGGFDFILDCVGKEETTFATELLKSYTNATYVSIVVPFLRNNDEMGFPLGLAKNVVTLGLDTIKHLREGKHYRWALFLPNGRALAKVCSLVDEGKIRPTIERVFPFVEVPEACAKVQGRHNRGKTVVDVRGSGDFGMVRQPTEDEDEVVRKEEQKAESASV